MELLTDWRQLKGFIFMHHINNRDGGVWCVCVCVCVSFNINSNAKQSRESNFKCFSPIERSTCEVLALINFPSETATAGKTVQRHFYGLPHEEKPTRVGVTTLSLFFMLVAANRWPAKAKRAKQEPVSRAASLLFLVCGSSVVTLSQSRRFFRLS